MLELKGDATGLLDEPLLLRLRGLGDEDAAAGVTWRARLRDDDERVWRAVADSPRDLMGAFELAKPDPRHSLAALRSLRPVRIDVRAEALDGRAAARTVTRTLVGDGVRLRRWRGVLPGAAATLHLPADEAPCATVVVDGVGDLAALAAPLLASRGVLALTVAPAGRGRESGADDLLAAAVELLAAVPGAAPAERIEVVAPLLPPGVPALEPGDAAAWDALLARLGARSRRAA